MRARAVVRTLILGLLLPLWLAILSACSPTEPEIQIATDLDELRLTDL